MENLSLYEYIEKLKQLKKVCVIRAQNPKMSIDEARNVRLKMSTIFKKTDDKLNEIAEKHAIDYEKLIQIIDKQTNKKHKLKCFREVETFWEVNDGSMTPIRRYTGRYLMGFINEDNKFYNAKQNDLGYSSLTTTEYAKMLEEINENNSIVLNSSEYLGLHKMFVLDLVKNKNYIQMVTHDYRFWNDFYQETTSKMLHIISEELKNVEYKQGNTTITEDLGL